MDYSGLGKVWERDQCWFLESLKAMKLQTNPTPSPFEQVAELELASCLSANGHTKTSRTGGRIDRPGTACLIWTYTIGRKRNPQLQSWSVTKSNTYWAGSYWNIVYRLQGHLIKTQHPQPEHLSFLIHKQHLRPPPIHHKYQTPMPPCHQNSSKHCHWYLPIVQCWVICW